eukprot:3936626-Rhodomonas_salina.1
MASSPRWGGVTPNGTFSSSYARSLPPPRRCRNEHSGGTYLCTSGRSGLIENTPRVVSDRRGHAVQGPVWGADEHGILGVFVRHVMQVPVALDQAAKGHIVKHNVVEQLLCRCPAAEHAHLRRLPRFLPRDQEFHANELMLAVDEHALAFFTHYALAFACVQGLAHKALFIHAADIRHGWHAALHVVRHDVLHHTFVRQSRQQCVQLEAHVISLWRHALPGGLRVLCTGGLALP